MRTPEEYNKAIQDKLKEAMEGKHSIITGKRKSLHISNIGFGELPDTDDYARQKQLLLNKETEGVNMYGNVSLIDNKTGQILDNNPNAKLGFVPTITNRFSNIIGGKEYIVHNQFRLRPAIYTKLDRLGQAQADFNLAKGKNLSISYQPAKEQMMVKVGTHNLPLYTYLKDVYKVPDKELIQTFGPDMHMQEMAKYQPKREQLLTKLHETYFGKKPDVEVGSIGAKIKEQLDKTEMDANTNMRTLGQAYSKVNDKALLHAASDVLEIYKGNKQPTWKDNIAYKSVHSIEDFLHERLAKPKPVMEIHNRLIPRIDRANKVSEVGAGQVFKKNILDFFKDSNLVNYPQQVNPMEFLENAHKITSLGEGGVSDTNELPIDARNLHFSQAGFVDPVRTPDDLKAGIDLRITLPTWKDKDVLKTAAVDKNGKRIIVSHTDMFDKTYAIDTEPEQPNGLYRAFHKGKIVEVPKSKIELWLPNESMFTVTSAAIPFIKNNQGQRVAMGAKMTTQALSLVHREKPLVDTAANQIMAGFYTPKAKATGTVVNITKDNIHIQDEAGKLHNHNIPNNMPLNYHSYLHVDPMVKVGEKVTKGQLLGDNNFTVSGANALGVNATVAYMPLHGYNYEDGFAISQTGAEKMSSNHVFTEEMDLTNSSIIPDEKKYRAFYPNKFTMAQYNMLDGNVIKKGQTVHSGDPIILAIKKKNQSPEVMRLGKMASRLANPFGDAAITWTKDYPGEVIEVVKNPAYLKVIIRAVAPMVIGDKICFDEETELLTGDGWKNIADISLADKVYTLNKETDTMELHNPTDLHNYPQGGKMYYVKNSSIDVLVTECHDLYVKTRTAKEFVSIPARDVKGKRVRFKKSANWKGTNPKFVTIPGMEVKAGQSGSGSRQLPDLQVPIEAYLMIMGAFLSEGNLVNHSDSGTYGFDITQIKVPNRELLITALNKLGIKFNEHGIGTKVRIHSKQWMEHLKPLGNSKDKFIFPWIFELDKPLLKLLFDWMMWGDGTAKNGRPVTYTTISKQLANDVQRIVLHIGFAGTFTISGEAGMQTIKGKEYYCQERYDVRIITTKLTPEINHGHVHRQNVQEEGFIENYTKPVYCLTVPNHIVYMRRNGKTCFISQCGRFGNKGVVTRIVPDNEAPRMLDGTIPDVYMNPAGIPSRMNLGQVYETALAKVLDQKKLGSLNYKNFTKSNTFQEITDLMKKHGVSDTETMFDPVSGRNIPKVFTGKQYFMKLFKQTEVNYSARAGGEYDIDQRPVRGGDDGSKSLGALDFYGMLAHNSRSLLREAATAKAEYNPEVWKSILSGKPLPPPKSTFAFDKVMTMIKGMGVNIKKEGNSMKATPFIDKDILALSKGEIKEATMTMEKPDPETGLSYRPEKGGLFDPAITGGLTGSDWGHIHLATPVVNQMFEKPIRALLDMKQKDFGAISDGTMHVSVDGVMQTGGDAIKGLLNKIDVNSELKRVQGELSHTTSAIKRDPLLKKQKTLSVLQANNMHPAEAYIMHNIPIIPPKYRPVYPKETGEIVTSDANHLYREIINLNNQLKSPLTQASGKDSDRYKALHTELTTSVKKMQGIDGKTADVKEREPAGFMDIIKGKGQPKYGYFQGKLLARAQDLVGRGTIAPDPTLGIDECALPEPMCWTLYGPFVIGQFVRNGYDLPKAQNEIKNRTMAARNLLQAEMNKRPCILNRAPTLHKFGMMAFTPQMTQGRTIKICPLIVKGFGADFDGDSSLSGVFSHVTTVDNNPKTWYKLSSIINIGENNMPTRNRILGSKGLTNLRDFPRVEESKVVKGNVDWYDVPEGVLVLTLDNDRQYKWLQPESYTVHRGLEMLNVVTHKHRTVTVSTDHSLVTLDENLNLTKAEPRIDMLVPVRNKPVFEYSVGSIELNFPEAPNKKHTFKEEFDLNYETGYLIGCIAGDGWVSENRTSSYLCLACITPEMDKKWKEIIETYVVNEPVHFSSVNADHEYQGFSCRSQKITWSSAGDFALLVKEWVGHKAENKHLPEFFLESPIQFRKGLLAGLIDTDGSVSINTAGIRKERPQANINFTSISRTLAYEVVALANTLGMVAGVTHTQTPGGKECYAVYFSADSVINIKKTIILYHPDKAAKLKLVSEDALVDREKYGPPLTEVRMKELCKLIGSPRLTKKGTTTPITEDLVKLEGFRNQKRLYGNVYDAVAKRAGRKGFLTMTNCKDIVELGLPIMDKDPFWKRWKEWVLDEETGWENIVRLDPIPHITEAYDLTIPPAYTMVTESSITVFDTMTVHLPISDSAIQEANRMKPSQNLFNPLDKAPMHVPDMETIMGLHLITKPNEGLAVKKFNTVAEAQHAYDKGHIGIQDKIEVAEIKK